MPLRLDELRKASTGFSKRAAEQITESYADQAGLSSVFLCHSHHDGDYVRGFIIKLREAGWNVYVDWMDTEMPENPTRETAEKIQTRIRKLTYFLYLATPNSSSSRWCPWEIGYADGVKDREEILICTTVDYAGHEYGAEYLQLYRTIDIAENGGLGVWQPNTTTGGVLLESL